MGLITPGYLTGLYHPDRYFMADYHPEYGEIGLVRGVAAISDPLAAPPSASKPLGSIPTNTLRQLGSDPHVSKCGQT